MANPTTNYGWPMPTATDLVTDLPADFAAFGQPVDTSLKALNPETTLGDISYRSSTANTNTRLAIGSTGQILTVAGGVPSWASPASSGGMTLLSTTSLSGASTTISIGTGYKNLQINVEKTNTTANDQYFFRFNGDSGSNYKYVGYEQNGTTDQLVGSGGYATFVRLGYTPSSSNTISQQVINIPNYLTDTWKLGNYTIANLDGSSPNRPTLETQSFSYNSATAISSITFGCMYNTFNAGTVKIYGVN
jgi:predicted secreted protein